MTQIRGVMEWLSRGVEVAAAIIIALAALDATLKAIRLLLQRSAQPEAKTEVRLTLGRWLAVSLEFLLAADILGTAVAPTWDEIGKLAAIAAIRTALNYFLGQEIENEASAGRHTAERRLQAEAAPHPDAERHTADRSRFDD